MRLLLDTHIWIWSHLEPSRLTPAVPAVLEDQTNEVWLSPISIWEASWLVEKRRIVVVEHADEWIRELLRTTPVREASLTSEVAFATSEFRMQHGDPRDAFLAATAKIYDLVLVTSDGTLLGSKKITTMSNR